MKHKLVTYSGEQFIVCEISKDMTNFNNDFGGMMFFERNILIKNEQRSCILSKKVAYCNKKIIGKISELNDEKFNQHLMLRGLFIKQWLKQGEFPLFLFNENDREFKCRYKNTPDDLLILKILPENN